MVADPINYRGETPLLRFFGRLSGSTGSFVLGAALGLAVSFAWVGRSWNLNWGELSDVGQALGALLSGAALVGAVVSLRLQRRQTQVSAFEALRNVRMQLLQFAIENPQFLRLWGHGMRAEEDAQECEFSPRTSWSASVECFSTLRSSLLGAGAGELSQ
jgi:hypothetical protein